MSEYSNSTLEKLAQAAEAIHDQLDEFRVRVRSAMRQVDISDRDAEGIAAAADALRDRFDDAYESMQACDEQIVPGNTDYENYKGLRARLIDDFRQLNIIQHDFDRNRERPEEERERIPELDEEPEETEDQPDEEPEEEVYDDLEEELEEEDADDAARKQRQKKLSQEAKQREEASHREAQERAAAETRRRAEADAAAWRTGYDTQATAPTGTDDYARRAEAERDARLAQEAEDKAHREAMTREQSPQEPTAPQYGYTGPEYGPKYEPVADDRPKYSRELHEELVDKYREREQDIVYDAPGRPEDAPRPAAGYAPAGFTPAGFTEATGFHMPPPPYRAPEPVNQDVQSPVGHDRPDAGRPSSFEQPVYERQHPAEDGSASTAHQPEPHQPVNQDVQPPAGHDRPDAGRPSLSEQPVYERQHPAEAESPFTAHQAPVFTPQDMEYTRAYLQDRAAAESRPMTGQPSDGAAPTSFTPLERRSGRDLMDEARARVSHVDVPDMSQIEVVSSAGSTFGLHAHERGHIPSFVPSYQDVQPPAGHDRPDAGRPSSFEQPAYERQHPAEDDSAFTAHQTGTQNTSVYRPTIGAYVPTVTTPPFTEQGRAYGTGHSEEQPFRSPAQRPVSSGAAKAPTGETGPSLLEQKAVNTAPDMRRPEAPQAGGPAVSHGFDHDAGMVHRPAYSSVNQEPAKSAGPSLLEQKIEGKAPGSAPAANTGAPAKPGVQAMFGDRLSNKQAGTDAQVTSAAAWAASAAYLQPNAMHEPGTQVKTRPSLPLLGEHSQIYGIVSGDGKSVYIDKAPNGKLSEVFQAHQDGRNVLTAGMFQQSGESGASPVMVLMADYKGTAGGTAQPIQAFAKRLQDNGMNVIVAGGQLGKLTLGNMSEGGLQVYDGISQMPAKDLLSNQSALTIKKSGGFLGKESLVINKVQGLTADNVGIHSGKADKADAGATSDIKSKGKMQKGGVVTDPREDSLKSALDKFSGASSGTTRSAAMVVRQALMESLTQGSEAENPFIGMNKTYYNARRGLTIARAVALPVTAPTAAMAAAVQQAVVEKALYGKFTAMNGHAFSSLYNKTAADIAKLTQDISGATGENLVELQAQLKQAKRQLAKMDGFKAMKAESNMTVQVKARMADARGIARHNLHRFDVQTTAAMKSLRDKLAEAPEFAGLRAKYGKDLLSVTDKQLMASMEELKASGRITRTEIKALKAQLKQAKPGEVEALKLKLKKLTAQSKANAASFNAHRQLLETKGEMKNLATVSTRVKDGVLKFRSIAKMGSLVAGGMIAGYMVRASATSGDYGLSGISILSNDILAIRTGTRFVGRHTGLSRVTYGLRRHMQNTVSDVLYRFTAPVRHVVERAVAPVKTVASKAATSAVSAATHGTSVIATKVATAISKATPASVKASAVAAKGGLAAVKQAAAKTGSKLAGTTVGRAVGAGVRAVGRVFSGISHAISAIGGLLGAVGGFFLAVVGWFILIYICLVMIVSVFAIFDSGSETSDGKIDLSQYDTYINEAWVDYQEDLESRNLAAAYGCESVEWDIPDTPGNKLVILTLLKVRVEHQTSVPDLIGGLGGLFGINTLEDYLWYMTEALNPIRTHVDEREREVWVEDADGEGGHYETEIYYVLEVSIDQYIFTGEGDETHLINAQNGDTEIDAVDDFGNIAGLGAWAGWGPDEKELCDLIYHMDWGELYSGLTGITVSSGDLETLTPDAEAVLEDLPAELSPERRLVVETALSLVGKVNYFWGGKSLVIGWDDRWGVSTKVWADGSSTTGTYRPYGLDCSGFVDWVFYNATGGEYVIGHGGGAHAQHTYCTNISWSNAQIGDLVFYPEDSHVGIVCGFDDSGSPLIVHCASSQNNVVVTGLQGFTSIARPNVYGSWSY